MLFRDINKCLSAQKRQSIGVGLAFTIEELIAPMVFKSLRPILEGMGPEKIRRVVEKACSIFK